MAIDLNTPNNNDMGAITDVLKLIASITLLIIIDVFINRLVGLTITWWIDLNTLFSIIIGLLLIWVLPMIVMLVGIAVNFTLNLNRFAYAISLLMFLYFAAAGILWIYDTYSVFNFHNTKQAIAGSGAIIYHLIKMSYCCNRSAIGMSL